MELDGNLQVFNKPKALTATTLSDNSIDQQTVGRHMENGDTIGIGFFCGLLTPHAGNDDTYQFQIVQADDAALSVNLEVLADTGVMTDTDKRILATAVGFDGGFFLDIPPGVLTREFVGAKFIGANTPNLSLNGAWLMNRAEWEQWKAQPANYVP